jgi:DNA-binding transcriptional ArsR family regulator
MEQDQGSSPDGRIEGAFTALTEDLVDAILSENTDELLSGYQGLRKLYAVLVGRHEVDTDSNPAYGLGRVVGFLDIAGDVVRRVLSGVAESELLKALEDSSTLKILNALFESGNSMTSVEISQKSVLDKAIVSRKLDHLEWQGLVTSHRLGKHRLSRLTRQGNEFVRVHLIVTEEGAPEKGDEETERLVRSFAARSDAIGRMVGDPDQLSRVRLS